jgi:NADH:ubiquinone oxidoreductase subunit 4 (subunit M)
MPKWSFFFFILILSNAGIPGTINFVAEITLIGGLFENFNTVAIFILIALVISSFRNFLLFTQICMGVSSRFLNPYLVYEDTKKKKFL